MAVVGVSITAAGTGVARADGTMAARWPALADVAGWVAGLDDARNDDHTDLTVAVHGYGRRSKADRRIAERTGVLLHLLAEWDIDSVVVPAVEVRRAATGRGSASMRDVTAAAVEHLGLRPTASNAEAEAAWARHLVVGPGSDR